MRRLIIAVALFVPMLAFAQETDDAASKVTTLSRHISEMRDLLQTPDATVRDAAIETSLHDPSPAIRGMAIYYALRRYDHLPLAFALPAGSAIEATELPSLVLGQVQWTADGRSLKAFGGPCGGYIVTGQVTGDRLRLQYLRGFVSAAQLRAHSRISLAPRRKRFHMSATRSLLPHRPATRSQGRCAARDYT